LFIRRQLDDEARVEVAKVVERGRCISSTLPTGEKLNHPSLLLLGDERADKRLLFIHHVWFVQSNIMPLSRERPDANCQQDFQPQSPASMTFSAFG
jgi:hypothetical protein